MVEDEGQTQSADRPKLRGSWKKGHVPETAFTAESAAAAGRKSGEARRRKAEMTPEERVWDAVDQQLPDLARELADAALGRGDFAELKLETRVSALKTVLEMRLGKPRQAHTPNPSIDEADKVPSAPEDLFEN